MNSPSSSIVASNGTLMNAADSGDGLYIMLLSIHGLVRGSQMELGKDADTGGQIQYVVELAKALSQDPRVGRVDLVTRLVQGKGVDPSYSVKREALNERASIVRIPFGPKRYLKKESLWPYLFELVDGAIGYLRKLGRTPDIIHGHYADAGYAGSHLAQILGVPFVFTGHSLGRVKRLRLAEKAKNPESLDKRFNFPARVEAEEMSLDTASLVVVSTNQEIEEQYHVYDHYDSSKMRVIPPGLDLGRFRAPTENDEWPSYFDELKRFLREPEKPMILAIARPDARKNLDALVRAYGGHPKLRELANLVIVAGTRDHPDDLDPSARKVLRNLMVLIDEYDLYGSVAYPKQHKPSDIPELYFAAAKSKGVFVNPALTEPFGLTLVEAAASGLPVVATNDGGPRDILAACHHGILINPYDTPALGENLYEAVAKRDRWKKWAASARPQALKHYTWEGHVKRYLDELEGLLKSDAEKTEKRVYPKANLTKFSRLLVTHIRGIFSEGDENSRKQLMELFQSHRENTGLCVSTRLNREEALQKIEELDAPRPDFVIGSSGTEIFSGPLLVSDKSWERHIQFRWAREKIVKVLQNIDGLRLENDNEQRYFRITYDIRPDSGITREEIAKLLRQHNIQAQVTFCYGHLFDIIPIRASTGHALRHIALVWGIPSKDIIVCRYQTGDESMLLGTSPGVVLGKHDELTRQLQGRPHIYFADQTGAGGVLSGIKHFDFLSEPSQ